ncbi:hypothetical protein TNCT_505081 [Trichonephila clavata]|uniref:Uncharacterized protein n=1 Tax=Trichonephila clavata TaxID=2740835 RepID=A0A8X6F1I0_TRICU|nr:hypothetical protein TNCT_505081 [Trichonephila clavata]
MPKKISEKWCIALSRNDGEIASDSESTTKSFLGKLARKIRDDDYVADEMLCINKTGCILSPSEIIHLINDMYCDQTRCLVLSDSHPPILVSTPHIAWKIR